MLNFIFYLMSVFLITTQISAVEPASKDDLPKILVVEDHQDMRVLTVETLEEMMFEVRSAENVEEGLSLWKSFDPDIVITDMNMPLTSSSISENQEAGLILLQKSPNDKAKVILASNESHISHEALSMIDYNLDGKVRLSSIKGIIETLLKSKDQPARIKKEKEISQKCSNVFKNT